MAKPEEHVYDPVNERVVIAAAIADTDTRTRLVRNIAADEFLVPQHAAIWRALRVCVDRKLRYDPEVMRRLVVDEMASFDPEYLEPMEQDSELPINLDWHVETLRWDACKARILQGPLPELLKDLKDPKASPEICSTNARALLRSIEGGHGRKYIRRGEELNREYKAEIAATTAPWTSWKATSRNRVATSSSWTCGNAASPTSASTPQLRRCTANRRCARSTGSPGLSCSRCV